MADVGTLCRGKSVDVLSQRSLALTLVAPQKVSIVHLAEHITPKALTPTEFRSRSQESPQNRNAQREPPFFARVSVFRFSITRFFSVLIQVRFVRFGPREPPSANGWPIPAIRFLAPFGAKRENGPLAAQEHTASTEGARAMLNHGLKQTPRRKAQWQFRFMPCRLRKDLRQIAGLAFLFFQNPSSTRSVGARRL